MDNNRVNILAMYLPQYHAIPENSKFWGEGFTDWVGVKKAEPLFLGHKQPQEPLSGYYYDLSRKEDVEWQVKLATKYGVSGFGIYHYWFSNDKVLLTKPAEIILENKEFAIDFFFAWDNANWRRTWSKFRGNAWAPLSDDEKRREVKGQSSILVKLELGGKEDWKIHFDYLLPYFLDKRYIKIDGKPLFIIFNYSKTIQDMADYWNELAIENGFQGMCIVYKNTVVNNLPEGVNNFFYEPPNSGWTAGWKIWYMKLLNLTDIIKTIGPLKYSYDKIWKRILKSAKTRVASYEWHGAFVGYDDTPRRGKRGSVVLGATPEKFEKYLSEMLAICKKQGKKYLFLTAWNEWGEGAVLEPTKENGYLYLEAVRKAVDKQ